MAQRRTDLAVEAHQLWREGAGEEASLPGVRAAEEDREGFPVTTVTISSQEGARALGKPQGTYITIELDSLLRREEGAFQRAVTAVADTLRPLLPGEGPALVVGLGNRAVTPDLIGPLAVDHLLVTRHLVEQVPEHFGNLRPVAAAAPGVLASTGLESSLVARALADRLSPACVIAVDALASRSLDRLCRTVQLSDAGVVPGSGVGNHRRALDRESLGAPVFTVGVPTVVDGTTLALDLLERAGQPLPDRAGLPAGENFFVTPREVDQRVADLGKVLGYAVSLALNPSLSVEDLTMLLE
ncbi:MAG: GPR endopeptidase [Oscillospiraceae bacterium]|nr:GPR endopeptidase [Oscillospiraceae bacterium]